MLGRSRGRGKIVSLPKLEKDVLELERTMYGEDASNVSNSAMKQLKNILADLETIQNHLLSKNLNKKLHKELEDYGNACMSVLNSSIETFEREDVEMKDKMANMRKSFKTLSNYIRILKKYGLLEDTSGYSMEGAA